MLHLRDLGLLELEALTATGETLDTNLQAWEKSERRKRFQEKLLEQDGGAHDDVILPPDKARKLGLASTLVFPRGNLAPEGSVVKATAIDPAVLNSDGAYHQEGPARVFVSEKAAMAAIKQGQISAGDVLVLAGVGPLGTGMEETYQVTGALKHLPFGKHVTVITDARFSGVSTGACIGHVAPEGLAHGPIGKLQDGDRIRIHLDLRRNEGTIDLVGSGDERFDASEGNAVLARRKMRPDLAPNPALPEDTRLWAALQLASGGTWAGCVYDAERICSALTRA
jgi:dihydroxyacid dehydratase/phosphogluconate dehydratase